MDWLMLLMIIFCVMLFIACVVFLAHMFLGDKEPVDRCIHDWDMKFVGEGTDKPTLDSYYECSKCGQKRTLMPEPWEMLE